MLVFFIYKELYIANFGLCKKPKTHYLKPFRFLLKRHGFFRCYDDGFLEWSKSEILLYIDLKILLCKFLINKHSQLTILLTKAYMIFNNLQCFNQIPEQYKYKVYCFIQGVFKKRKLNFNLCYLMTWGYFNIYLS